MSNYCKANLGDSDHKTVHLLAKYVQKLKQSKPVKETLKGYLGVIIDDKLNWKSNTMYLFER